MTTPQGKFCIKYKVNTVEGLDSPQQRLTYIFDTLVNTLNEKLDSRQQVCGLIPSIEYQENWPTV